MDDWSSWHQRSSWAQPLGTGRLFKLSSELWVRHRKIQDSAGKHCGLARLGSFLYCLLSRSSRSLARGGFLDRLSAFFWTGTLPNHCQIRTKLSKIVKNSLITGYRYTTPRASGLLFLASIAGPRPGTGLLPVLWITWQPAAT